MAVEQARIKARLRALFPGVNLSNKRLDELSARLSQKPADDAEDAAIDEILNNANDLYPFADIAKEDDRVRNLEANQKKKDPEPAPQPSADPSPEKKTDDTPEWAKALIQEVQTLKSEKQQQTIREQLKAKLKDVPEAFYKRAALPTSVEELDSFAEEIKTDYTAYRQEEINSQAGGKVLQGNGPNSKEASKEQIDAVLDNIM